MSQASNSPTSKRVRVEPGQRYGQLVAVEFVERDRHTKAIWRWRCDCGQEHLARTNSVLRGLILSCGCLRAETAATQAQANTTHGMRHSPEYKIWVGMLNRCTNPASDKFHLYGGRGIKVCEQWQKFAAFYADMGPRPSPKHSIDRYPDQNGNYEPGNVRWATDKEQQRNLRSNRLVSYHGRTIPLVEAAELAGVSYVKVKGRLQRGWSVERALKP